MEALGLLSSVELFVRTGATAAIVIAVALSVDRFGPLVGGAIAGLPIVLAPGFFFLLREYGAGFAAASAAHSLLSLCGTQAFLLAYMAAASRWTAGVALACAVLAWAATAAALSFAPASAALAGLLFAASTLVARSMGRRFLRPLGARRSAGGPLLLLARGVLAGLLVAGVTAAASLLGPDWSGLLLAFPVGLSVIAPTVHQRLGAGAASTTLHSTMMGVVSLAAFCGVLTLALPSLGAILGFALALLAALAATLFVTFASAGRPRLHAAP